METANTRRHFLRKDIVLFGREKEDFTFWQNNAEDYIKLDSKYCFFGYYNKERTKVRDIATKDIYNVINKDNVTYVEVDDEKFLPCNISCTEVDGHFVYDTDCSDYNDLSVLNNVQENKNFLTIAINRFSNASPTDILAIEDLVSITNHLQKKVIDYYERALDLEEDFKSKRNATLTQDELQF